jgi:hypothetical protein
MVRCSNRRPFPSSCDGINCIDDENILQLHLGGRTFQDSDTGTPDVALCRCPFLGPQSRLRAVEAITLPKVFPTYIIPVRRVSYLDTLFRYPTSVEYRLL